MTSHEEDRLDTLRWLAGKKYRQCAVGDWPYDKLTGLIADGLATRRGCHVFITDAGREALMKGPA